MIADVNLTGPLGGDSRYTLYPATKEMLGDHEIVAECELPESFWAAKVCSFPQPARTDNATTEDNHKLHSPRKEWTDFLIWNVER
jgi:hypothetical protein